MTVKAFNKPFIAPTGSAKRVSSVLSSPAKVAGPARKSNIMSVDEAIRKYGTKK